MNLGNQILVKHEYTRRGSHAFREKVSAAMKAKWADPDFRAEQLANPKRIAANNRNLVEAKQSRWATDPQFRKEQRVHLALGCRDQSPESCAKRSATLKAKWADPEFKAAQLANPKRIAGYAKMKRSRRRHE